jgi:hypothetical protein
MNRIIRLWALGLCLCLCSCGVSKDKQAEIYSLLGTYEGPATQKRVMGALMSGKWTVRFVLEENGELKCKCTLRLHDQFHGWGAPTTETARIKWTKDWQGAAYYGVADSMEGNNFSVRIAVPPLESGQSVSRITLWDADSYELTLERNS